MVYFWRWPKQTIWCVLSMFSFTARTTWTASKDNKTLSTLGTDTTPSRTLTATVSLNSCGNVSYVPSLYEQQEPEVLEGPGVNNLLEMVGIYCERPSDSAVTRYLRKTMSATCHSDRPIESKFLLTGIIYVLVLAPEKTRKTKGIEIKWI